MDFGFLDGMPYEDSTNTLDEMLSMKNDISKERILNHMRKQKVMYASCMSTDLFTGERFEAGVVIDGDFYYPIDMLRYIESGKFGIPLEYEKYIVSRGA